MNENTATTEVEVIETAPTPPPECDDQAVSGSETRAPWDDLLQRFEGCLADLRGQVNGAEAAVTRLFTGDAERVEQARIREALLEKIDASRPAFQFQLIRPVVQRLAGIIDLVAGWNRNPPATVEIFADHLRLLETQLQEILMTQGIESIDPAVGDAFDRRFHYVVETQPSGDSAQHERIAATVQKGYVLFTAHEKTTAVVPTVIRPAKVVIWKHNPALCSPASEPGTGTTAEPPVS